MNQLNNNEITNLMAIIDMATQKGLFKAADLSTIGQLYDKLKAMSSTAISIEKKD